MTKAIIEKINFLYGMAKTAEGYNAVINAGEELARQFNEESSEYFAAMIEGLNYFWGRYYKQLKFALADKEEAENEALQLLDEVDALYQSSPEPQKMAKILYLKIVILANLLNDSEGAEAEGEAMAAIILKHKLPLDEYLRYINAMGINAMAEAKTLHGDAARIKWGEAIDYFSQIADLTEDELVALESPDTAANVLSNLGAAILRGKLNADDREERLRDIQNARGYLYLAECYYLKKEPPSATHLQGIENRFAEADREEAKINMIE